MSETFEERIRQYIEQEIQKKKYTEDLKDVQNFRMRLSILESDSKPAEWKINIKSMNQYSEVINDFTERFNFVHRELRRLWKHAVFVDSDSQNVFNDFLSSEGIQVKTPKAKIFAAVYSVPNAWSTKVSNQIGGPPIKHFFVKAVIAIVYEDPPIYYILCQPSKHLEIN